MRPLPAVRLVGAVAVTVGSLGALPVLAARPEPLWVETDARIASRRGRPVHTAHVIKDITTVLVEDVPVTTRVGQVVERPLPATRDAEGIPDGALLLLDVGGALVVPPTTVGDARGPLSLSVAVRLGCSRIRVPT